MRLTLFLKEIKLKIKNIALVIFIAFSLSVIGLYLFKKYNQINAPKIVLESKTNPTEVTKPEPTRKDMNLDMLEQTFEETSLSEDSQFEVDSIE